MFVKWEAMSPGDFARAAQGLTINYGWFDSPFGPALSMGTDRGICGLAFRRHFWPDIAMSRPALTLAKRHYVENPDASAAWINSRFGLSGDTATAHDRRAVPDQVWEALLRIPSGTSPPIPKSQSHRHAQSRARRWHGRGPQSRSLLIPCHRALRKSGALGGYHWGLPSNGFARVGISAGR